MLSGIFVVAGINHLAMPAQVAQRLAQAPMEHLTSFVDPKILVLLAGVGLLIAGLALLTGWKTRLAAAALIALIIPITLSVQIGSMNSLGPLFKNIGLAGGLIYFAAHGSNIWSIDAWMRRRTPEHKPH